MVARYKAKRQQLIDKMKSNKLGLITAIALGGLMACGPISALAQDNATPPPPAGGDNANPGQRPRGNRGIQNILSKLDLTDDQKAKVKPIAEDNSKQMREVFQDSSLSREDRRDKIKTINDATNAKLKDILTADQYTKYLDLQKQMMNRRRGGAPAGGGNTTTPPPAKPDNN